MDSNKDLEKEDQKDADQTARETTKQQESEETAKERPAMESEQESQPKRRHIRRWVLLGVGIVLVALLITGGVLYYQKAEYYQTHFLPGTVVNNVQADEMTAQDLILTLEDQSTVYELVVTDQDGEEVGIINRENIALEALDVGANVEEILENQDWKGWILAYFRNDAISYDFDIMLEFDEDMATQVIRGWDKLASKNMKKPEDAYISEYDSSSKGYTIVEETRGSLLDVNAVTDAVLDAIRHGENEINLDEADCYIRAQITSEDKTLTRDLDKLNTMVSACITYDWNGAEVTVDGDLIHEWIIEDEENGGYTIDKNAVTEFVESEASKHDTYGVTRSFTTTLGRTVTLSRVRYGWKTNTSSETDELYELVLEGAVESRDPVYSSTGAVKGSNDIGNSYVEIDLTNQHLYLYVNGGLITESDLVSGNMSRGNGTPAGLYALTYKTRNATLKGEDYSSFVNYWMPFNGNIGMHDASWRSSFGGDIYLTNGSHGCINLPYSAAQTIYEYVYTGFPVICYYY